MRRFDPTADPISSPRSRRARRASRSGDLRRRPPRRRLDLVLGRSLSEINDLRETVARSLALALAPTTILILFIGALFAAAPASLGDIHAAIAEIMKGDLKQRLR